MTSSLVSLGVAGSLGPDLIARLAPFVESAGFHALWVNDTPGADSLAVLAAAAAVTDRLVLATGVVPIDRRPPREIVAAVRSADGLEQRLVLGVGSGAIASGAVAAVREAVTVLRAELESRVLVGALGPRMRRLAAVAADGPLLSWLTPEVAAEQAAAAHAISPSRHAALYVRAALDPAARGRLLEEAARYTGYPVYAANFARLGIAAAETVLLPESFAARIGSYRAAVDEVVLRAITPGDSLDDYRAFVDRAASVVGT